MKIIKLFEEFLNDEKTTLTKEQLDFLDRHKRSIDKWTVNSEGKIDVKGGVSISYNTNIEKIPVKFGEITGDFSCRGCDSLVSLEGAPDKVGGYFDCSACDSLTSLKGAPVEVRGWFSCDDCPSLASLKDASCIIHDTFQCARCTSLPIEEIEITKESPEIAKHWLKSGLSLKEFKIQKRGLIAAKKFGF